MNNVNWKIFGYKIMSFHGKRQEKSVPLCPTFVPMCSTFCKYLKINHLKKQ